MDLSKYFNNKPKEDKVTDTVNEVVTDRIKGKIIKVDKERGYGFITSKDVPFTRIFFHWTSLLQTTKNFAELDKNMEVEFQKQEIEEPDDEGKMVKKVRAIKIRVL